MKYWMKPNSTATNNSPTPKMRLPISLVMMKASRERGLSFNTLWSGGKEAKAIAAKVSIMRLIHNICVTVSGYEVPITAPNNTIMHAATLMVIWNRINLWIFR